MTLSKKEKLINSLEELKGLKELTELEKLKISRLIGNLRKRDFDKESDLNATLTDIIYRDIISQYPSIMSNPKSERLRRFCIEDVGSIKSNPTFKSTPKIKR
jgi:hypothetical protein